MTTFPVDHTNPRQRERTRSKTQNATPYPVAPRGTPYTTEHATSEYEVLRYTSHELRTPQMSALTNLKVLAVDLHSELTELAHTA